MPISAGAAVAKRTPVLAGANWPLWAAAILSAGLLELPFPIAGPLPAWRTVFAWFGLVPLLAAVLSKRTAEARHPLRQAFLLAYLCGVLWYMGNCYWIYATMHIYGGLPSWVSVLLLVGFSLVLGLYCGLFGLTLAAVRRTVGDVRAALVLAPFLWAALDLAAARITSVPWDQLGYSQIDNTFLTYLAPWTGVYGITFVLVAVNALIAGSMLLKRCPSHCLADRRVWSISGVVCLTVGSLGVTIAPRSPQPAVTAVLVQPNLNVGADNTWTGATWDRHIAQFAALANEQCKSYIAGIPQTGAPQGEVACPPYPTFPELVVWPESPAPYVQSDPRLLTALGSIARQEQAPMIVGGIGVNYDEQQQAWSDYNSAMVISARGELVGRYDKIHLVPFGEYIPFQNLLSFAHKLTGRVGVFSRGVARRTFLLSAPGVEPHRYGIFICYESVFADEIRQFARNGAEVLVNISDDGWYGDTSAPWQHLNMVRMRAVENRRWILRDTNNGVTASIDPYGRVRQSIPRHRVDALPAQFAFRDDVTFYTFYGDVFAWICLLLGLGIVAWAAQRASR